MTAERDAWTAAYRFAQSQAVTAKARGQQDTERDWLDLLHLLDRDLEAESEAGNQPDDVIEAVKAVEARHDWTLNDPAGCTCGAECPEEYDWDVWAEWMLEHRVRALADAGLLATRTEADDRDAEIERLRAALTNARAVSGDRIAERDKMLRDIMVERDEARRALADAEAQLAAVRALADEWETQAPLLLHPDATRARAADLRALLNAPTPDRSTT